MSQYIDSRANLTLIRLMVDPLTPHCALPDSEISLTKALYYDVFRIINGTEDDKLTIDDKDKISRSDLRRQVKTVRYIFTGRVYMHQFCTADGIAQITCARPMVIVYEKQKLKTQVKRCMNYFNTYFIKIILIIK